MSLPFFARQRKPRLVLGTTGVLGVFRHSVTGSARAKHMFVLGITGQGKSKLLEHCLYQDIIAGRGCGLIDPHGSLGKDTIRYLASNPAEAAPHWERIIYFDPHSEYLTPFNVLAPTGDKHTIAGNVIEAFRRTWPRSLAEAARFSEIARSAFIVLIENNLTLLELRRLLTDEDYRVTLLRQVKDKETQEFFRREYSQWGKEQAHYINPLLNKSSAFLFGRSRLILGQKENKLNFKRIMDEGKILLCNLGGGEKLSAEARRLLGSLITTQLEQAALSRDPDTCPPWYCYIDEFQDVSANEGSSRTFSHILSQARKFGLHLILATQTLGNIDRRVRTSLDNIQTHVVMAIGRDDAEVMAKKIFPVDTGEIKHDAQTDTQHPLYSPLPEIWERYIQRLQNLPERHAYVKAPKKQPVKIRTITVKDKGYSKEKLKRLCDSLAKHSGYPRAQLEKKLENRGSSGEEHTVTDYEER